MPTIVVTPSATTAFGAKSRVNYRREISRELGGFELFTTDSAATGTNAASTLISTALIDAEKEATAYDRAWSYPVNGVIAGLQRRVRNRALTNSTGALLHARAWSSTPASGVEVEIHRILPAEDQDGLRGINRFINEALARLWTIDLLQFTGVANAYTYPLTTYPWLDRDDLLLDVLDVPTTGNPYRHAGGARIRYDAQSPLLQLETPFGNTDTFYVRVQRPLHTLVKVGGTTWTETTTGLTADADEALAEPKTVMYMAMALAIEEILTREKNLKDAKYWKDRLFGDGQRPGYADYAAAAQEQCQPNPRRWWAEPANDDYGGDGWYTGDSGSWP